MGPQASTTLGLACQSRSATSLTDNLAYTHPSEIIKVALLRVGLTSEVTSLSTKNIYLLLLAFAPNLSIRSFWDGSNSFTSHS